MNHFNAAGLFDNPWVVAAFLLAGAIINWLSKRRADNAAENQTPEETPETNPSPLANWEERLRRMLEEKDEQQPAPPTQAPPIIRRSPVSRPALPPVFSPVERSVAALRQPPSIEIAPMAELEFNEPVARRYELSTAAHAAQALQAIRRGQQDKSKRPILGSLRHPQTARRAFAASLVFGPPKGLEL